MADDISYYFKLAIEQYADINVFFTLDKCQYSQLKTLCVAVKNGYFVARASIEELNDQPLIWGSEASIYFTVRDPEFIPCHFTCRLLRLYNSPPNHMLLIFPLPKAMDHNQRRFSRRVDLSAEEQAVKGLWHGLLVGGDDENLPQLRWFDLLRQKCRIGEISSSGLRLELSEKSSLAGRLNVNDEILFKGDFAPRGKTSPIFIVGNIVRKMPSITTEDELSAGCQFLAWRKVNGPGETWFKVDNREGIAMISQWITRNFHSVRSKA